MKSTQIGLKALVLALFAFSTVSFPGQSPADGSINGTTAPKTRTVSADIGGQNQQRPEDTKPFGASPGIGDEPKTAHLVEMDGEIGGGSQQPPRDKNPLGNSLNFYGHDVA